MRLCAVVFVFVVVVGLHLVSLDEASKPCPRRTVHHAARRIVCSTCHGLVHGVQDRCEGIEGRDECL